MYTLIGQSSQCARATVRREKFKQLCLVSTQPQSSQDILCHSLQVCSLSLQISKSPNSIGNKLSKCLAMVSYEKEPIAMWARAVRIIMTIHYFIHVLKMRMNENNRLLDWSDDEAEQ